MRKILAAGAAVLAVGLTSTGCSGFQLDHSYNAPITNHTVPPATIIGDPYHFPTMVRVCVDGDGIYSSKGDTTAPFVLKADPACSAAK